jgi:hypothetical protein
MTLFVQIIVGALIAWWFVAPFIAIVIGVTRGHPFIGIFLGVLIPLVGPWAVNAAINSIERKR